MKHPLLLTIGFILLASLTGSAQSLRLHSYTPGEGLTFSSENDYQMTLRGYLQPYFEVKKYTDTNDPDLYPRFRMRRLRLRLTGNAPRQRIDYRFQIDLSGTSEVGEGESDFLLDAWVAYQVTKRIKISFGQRATPTDNRELTMGSQALQLVERSRVTSAFASIREFGLFAQGTFRTWKGSYIRPYLTLTNGDGLNAFREDYGGLKVGGRLDFLPFGLFTNFGQFRQADVMRERTPKLVFGGNMSFNRGMSSRRGRASGTILYLNDLNEESLPDYLKYGIDFLFKYRGFSALGEFVGSQAFVPDDITQRIRNNGTISPNFLVEGEQDVENYVKGRMMLGTGFNLQMGYLFKNRISVDARYTHLNADQHSFLNNGTFYNRPNYYTMGCSYYLIKGYGAKIQASFTLVDAADGSNDINSNPIEGNEWIGRLMASFAF
ncbi:MAG: porin [Bacteroidota bacterium]